MTWRVGSAVSNAEAPEGSVLAYAELTGVVRCGTNCADVSRRAPLTAACQQQGTVCPLSVFDSTPASSGSRDVTLVAEVTGITSRMLTVMTSLNAVVRGEPTCVFSFPGCNPVLDNHRGSGRSAIDAQLRSIQVQLP